LQGLDGVSLFGQHGPCGFHLASKHSLKSSQTHCPKEPRAAPEIGGKDQAVASANNLALTGRDLRCGGQLGNRVVSPALHFHWGSIFGGR
jgi:hypothetical protein